MGYPLPTAVVIGKFLLKPLISGHFPKTKAAAIASPVDTPPPYVSLFLLKNHFLNNKSPTSREAELF